MDSGNDEITLPFPVRTEKLDQRNTVGFHSGIEKFQMLSHYHPIHITLTM